jgi:putative peptidoglycan lipid II flippase
VAAAPGADADPAVPDPAAPYPAVPDPAVPGQTGGGGPGVEGADGVAAGRVPLGGYPDVAGAFVADDMAAEGAESAYAPEPARSGGVRTGFAGAAALIAGITILSRVVGFGRTLLLGFVAQPVLGQAYLTANTIPNIIFEIVAGGALAALVVPLVAGAIARSDRSSIGRTASALLTWVLSILVPLAILVAAFARPIITFAVSRDASPTTIDAGTDMLVVFAPQIPLYGIGIVLAGLLQAYRRFAWPVLAPLLSSVVVIATYLTYRLVSPPVDSVFGWMILATGTTLGVVVLSLCLIVPVARLGLRWRPTYRFAGDARTTVGGLAGVAVITVAAQQIALFIAVRLANEASSVALYTFTVAQTVYLVPWSVFALPVAMSVYPSLATSAETGDEDGYRRDLSAATRTVTLLSAFGAAALIAAATPLGRLFAEIAHATRPDPEALALAFATFAPGLIGYGLFALHSRALYARGQNRYAAIATLTGWGTVVAASFALAAAMPTHLRPAALTTANSIGMTVLAVVLGVIVAARTGRGSLSGLTRAVAAAIIAGAAAASAGILVRRPLPEHPGWIGDIGQGMLSGAVAVVVFGLVTVIVDRRDLAPILRRFRRRRS